MMDRESVSSGVLSFRNMAHLLLFLVLLASGSIICAQTVTIKLVDGRNGRPVAPTCVAVWSNNRMSAMLITNRDGIASLSLMDENEDHWKDCGVYGVTNTIVKYGDSLQIGVDKYLMCQPHMPNTNRHLIQNIPTKQVVDQGVVTPNTCGKLTASPRPGELIIFIRPYSFWEHSRAAIWE